MDIRKFVTERNKRFYDEVKSKFTLRAYRSKDEYWGSNLENGIANVYYAKTKWPEASLTHELLHFHVQEHGYLRIKGGISLDKNFLTRLPRLIGCLDNEFQHLKMFPIFKKAGFTANEFYNDGDDSTEAHIRKVISTSGQDFISLVVDYLTLNAPGGGIEATTMSELKMQFHNYENGIFKKNFEVVDKILNDWINDLGFDATPYFIRFFENITEAPLWVAYDLTSFPNGGFFINTSFGIEEINKVYPEMGMKK